MVDFETGQDWLGPGEVNIGYNVFAAYRRRGYATRAVRLLLKRIASEGLYETGVLSIAPGNLASHAVAASAGFTRVGDAPNGIRYARPVSEEP